MQSLFQESRKSLHFALLYNQKVTLKSVVLCGYNLNTRDVEASESKIHGYLQLYSKFETGPGYMNPCLISRSISQSINQISYVFLIYHSIKIPIPKRKNGGILAKDHT